MRNIKLMSALSSLITEFISLNNCTFMIKTNHPGARPINQKNVLKLACDPIPVVRIGIIGLGVRASRAILRFMHIEGVEIKALCDIVSANVEEAQETLLKYGRTRADEFVGADKWMQVCERDDIDLIYICTDWLTHTPIAVYGMEQNKHVAVEVPAAVTVDECWQLVDTAERMQKHCMILENCCYDFFELNILNMVQKGIFGDVLHAEGAYIHDLRERIFSNEFGRRRAGNWQNKFYTEHTGNAYPTHGLGPLCQVLNIHRGDKLEYLVSMSTKQQGFSEFAVERYGEDSPEAKLNFKIGDMNSTLIKTREGRTILIQYNVSNPRAYTRTYLLNGTKGYVQKYPIEQIVFDSHSNIEIRGKKLSNIFKKYTHPFIQRYGEMATQVCDERARDFIMDSRLIYCLRNGLPLDIDVYDAAEWSCLVELTEISVHNGSMPVEIPDFTRGDWQKLQKLDFEN